MVKTQKFSETPPDGPQPDALKRAHKGVRDKPFKRRISQNILYIKFMFPDSKNLFYALPGILPDFEQRALLNL